jgi:hypothetical protein
MLESIIELLLGVFGSALILLIASCIVGSIVAALRAVSREGDCEREDVKDVVGRAAEVTVSNDRYIAYGSQTVRANALR